MYAVDLNCDLGESYGNYICGMDEEVIPYISSANIACGFHASDPMVMAKTVALAKKQNVCVGAHPGYPDLVGFGRRNMAVSPEEVKAMVQYNMAAKDEKLALAICQGIKEVDPELILLGLSGSEMLKAAEKIGLKAAREVFADRAYEEDGSLVARSKEGAMITDEEEAIRRVIMMVKEGKVTAITGKEIAVTPHSVCIHGDGPKALAFVQKIRKTLEAEGITIAPLKEVIG